MKPLTVALGIALIIGGIIGLANLKAADSTGTGYALVGADLERFRSDFNAAKDHVRAVLLVARASAPGSLSFASLASTASK